MTRLGVALHDGEGAGLIYVVDETKPTAKHAAKADARRTQLDPFAVAAIRLLMLTGARLREILHAKWEYVDFERGVMFLPDSKTGKKPIYLSAAALAVLGDLPRIEGNPFIIAGAKDGAPRADLKKPWAAVTKAAGLEGVRIHDLRHSFASVGVGASLGLPIIGKLLGHSATLDNGAIRAPGRGPNAARGQCDRRDNRRGDERRAVGGHPACVEAPLMKRDEPARVDGPPLKRAQAWLAARDYSYLLTLDAVGWLKELEQCAHLESETARRKAGKPTFAEEWKLRGKDEKGLLDDQLAAGFVPGFIGPPPVEVVDKADQADLHALERPALIVQVWLRATDADIVAAFKQELREARKKHPSALTKRGPKATTGRFGKTEFKRWQTHKIVEISELYEWAASEGVTLTNAALGRLLFAHGDNPDKAAHIALKVRRQALDAVIRALWAQTVGQG